MAFYSNYILYHIQLVLVLCATCGLQSHGQGLPSLPPYPRWICPNSGNYTANSTYQSNLSLLLRSLPANGTTTGYADATVGDIPDRVYGLVLCRGDVRSQDCADCLNAAITEIPQYCPNSRSAIIWYEICLLRYANQRFLGTPDGRQLRNLMFNINNVTAPAFNASRWEVLGGLARYAVGNMSARPPMFAAGETDLSLAGDERNKKLYGLVQCTQDISRDDCGKCLEDLFDFLPVCCPTSVGAVVLAASCNIRYETYTFYNWSSRLLFAPLAAPPVAVLPGRNNATTGGGTGNKSKTRVIVVVFLSLGVAFLLSVTFGFLYVKKRVLKRKINRGEEPIEDFESLHFDLSIIKSATNNFASANILGRGGFGDVYKGILHGKEVAVKRLAKTSGQGLQELMNEVVLLAKLQHRNLVRILGVCLEGEEKLLVYEYIENKSLDKFLFDPLRKELLTWETRYKIINGIARGLLYLHEESQLKIIHRDLKASNILLDVDMNPKISDFGLARLCEDNETHAETKKIAGTLGYMAPEYACLGQFSVKSDVFSFGVLILEIVTGRKRTEVFSDETTDLLSYVWKHWSTGEALEILDQAVGSRYLESEVYRCLQIGLLCCQELPANRPTMAAIVLLLDSHSATVQNPGKPVMFAGVSITAGYPVSDSFRSTSDPSRSLIGRPTKLYSEDDSVVVATDPR